ncbi:MAG: ParB/RepB/Spo0J family partition protein [Gammaproteobacteria bacterium]|nr:ParB/RepB/Spo0J family partition protein [Gammaproteobacteria bacterium]
MPNPSLAGSMTGKRQSGVNRELAQLLSDGELQRVKLDLVDRDESQPRPLEEVLEGLEAFADELERDGIIQPPVFNIRNDGRYTIVVGERRTIAWRMKGHDDISAICKRFTQDELMRIAEIQYAENDEDNRKPLSPEADARWWRNYIDRYFGGNLSAAASARGKSPAWISNKLKILEVRAEIKAFVNRNEVRDDTAIAALARLDKHNSQAADKLMERADRGELEKGLRAEAAECAKQAKEESRKPTKHQSKSKPQSEESWPAPSKAALKVCIHPGTGESVLAVGEGKSMKTYLIDHQLAELKVQIDACITGPAEAGDAGTSDFGMPGDF